MLEKIRLISKVSALVLIMGATLTVYAQGPLQKRVEFSVNVPYALRMGEYLLPPGDYVLHQVLQNDLNLFSLHPGELRNKPIAMIRTSRIDYYATGYPEKTQLMIDTENSGLSNYPTLEGWTIPGLDGYEIISVVEKKKGTLRHIAAIYRDKR